MNILGISDNHGSGAALVRNGRLVAAVNEERIDREKNSLAFPWGAIDEVLRMEGLAPRDIDLVVVGSVFTPIFFLRLLRPFHQFIKRRASQFGLLFDLYIYYQILVRNSRLATRIETLLSRALFGRQFTKRGFACEIHLLDHHTAHAYSAFLTSPFEHATVITADAMGDGVSVTVGIAREGRIERIWAQDGRSAFNPYYSRVTELLGFVPNRHEGKVTGLAAYGDAEVLRSDFERAAHFRGPGFNSFRFWHPGLKHYGFFGRIGHYSRELIAAGCQRNLEVQMGAFVDHWVRKTGVPDVVLAGGIFENVKLNQRIHELDTVRAVYIFPNMSDGGLGAGAALAFGANRPRPVDTMYLGPAYDRDRIERAAAASGLVVERPEDRPDHVADLLAAGHVIARFDGAMEYGPRALGNRSILYRPDDPKVNDWLNERLRRTEFMPFAPVVRRERAADCFVGVDGAEFTARFMNICFDCTDLMKRLCPGVVHVDGTARPQILTREENPAYYDLLQRFEEKTGLPALINTSFNMHEEPIVMTPEDAVRAFVAARLPYLVLGHLVVKGIA
ncbi:MAG: carbamoyltransferase [Deltaproteobacteria bacterium]|nr:carbamoyltransferase [Deltaproteobacteria bacterium]